MPSVALKDLIESGVHFGHKASRWNPKMKPYIHGKRNLIHIIDLKETVRGMVRASNFLHNISTQGSTVLFVDTKRQAKNVVKEAAVSCSMPFATERWLGGMLTNYATVRSRLKKLEELERMVASGEIEQYSKKMQATINRNIRKLQRNLDGVRNMDRVPDAVIIVDPRREKIALQEANKLNIPAICILDTDCDPDRVDICIPANDDAMRSVQILCGHLAEAIGTGRKEYEHRVAIERKKAEDKASAEREKARKKNEVTQKKKADEQAVKDAMSARWKEGDPPVGAAKTGEPAKGAKPEEAAKVAEPAIAEDQAASAPEAAAPNVPEGKPVGETGPAAAPDEEVKNAETA